MSELLNRQLPNTLTVFRLILAGGFFASLNAYRYPDTGVLWINVAIGLFIAAAITDALDGYLARKWGVESQFGRLMDPFVDKVLIIGSFIFLGGPRFVVTNPNDPNGVYHVATEVYPWMVVVVLARELLVTGIRGLMEFLGEKSGALWSGKMKMILQCVAIPLVLFLVANVGTVEHAWARWTCVVLVYATVIVTVWSGIPYVMGFRHLLKAKGQELPMKS